MISSFPAGRRQKVTSQSRIYGQWKNIFSEPHQIRYHWKEHEKMEQKIGKHSLLKFNISWDISHFVICDVTCPYKVKNTIANNSKTVQLELSVFNTFLSIFPAGSIGGI